jgi:pimeloyl-ACP methyl ester carboxylesterase
MKQTLWNEQGEELAYTYVEGAPSDVRLVVVGHGLTSDKTRPYSEALSAALANRGIASLRVAFSGNGDSSGRFLDSNVTKEVRDLGCVLDALEGRRVAYVGHSMGAAVGVSRAVVDPRIVALVSLAGMVHTAEFYERMFGELSDGELLLGKPGKPLGPALREDLLSIESVAPLAAGVRVPWLLVHGDQDDVVPISDSRDIIAAAGGCAELVELPGVDHSFTGEASGRMAELVAGWMARVLA